MDVVFFLIFLTSFFALIAGVIYPPLFKTFSSTKTTPSRKKVAVIMGGIMVVSFIAFSITPSSTGGGDVEQQSTVTTAQQETASVDAADTSAEAAETATTTTEQKGGENDMAASSDADGDEFNGDEQGGNSAVSEPAPSQSEETSSAPATQYHAVTRVVDGDTFKVSINGQEETVRLIGIDTPESVDPRSPVECFGVEASNRAKQLLSGQRVRLEADPTQDERDRYGRILRYAWLENGAFFNQQMIAEGYAMEYTYNTPYQHQSAFKQAQREAETAKWGLWADGACTEEEAANEQPSTVSEEQEQPPATESGAAAGSGYKFYVSSYYSSKYYYCETDSDWKGLSEKYLMEYESEAALLEDYPSHTLHEPCN